MFILALALLVAYRVELIFHVAAFMVAASAAELPANWAQWWWWRFNRWGRLAASFGGIALPALVWFVLPTRHWPWWDRTYLVILANTALWLLVTLVTPADSPAVLERFYRRARPLGAWQPVRARLSSPAELQTGPSNRSGLDLIAIGLALALLGAGSVMLMTQGISHLYVGRFSYGLLELFGCAIGGGVFLRSYGPYLDRLELWTADSIPSEVPQMVPPASPVPLPSEGMPQADPSAEPMRMSAVIALAAAGFGIVIVAGGILFTAGVDRVLNLIGGLGFLIGSGLIAWIGRPDPKSAPC